MCTENNILLYYNIYSMKKKMYSFNINSIWLNTNFNNAYVFYFATTLPDNTNVRVILIRYKKFTIYGT